MSTDLMMYFSDAATAEQILKAACFAADAHRGQRRKDAAGTPYINHPLRVANICASTVRRQDIINAVPLMEAALLHDTVEDTATTFEMIEDQFGKQVADLVKEVTDDRTLTPALRKRAQIAHITQISELAQHIKLADKLDNCQDTLANAPPSWSLERIQGYFAWNKLIVQKIWDQFPELKTKLETVFNGQFLYNGAPYPCISSDKPLEAEVEIYLSTLDGTRAQALEQWKSAVDPAMKIYTFMDVEESLASPQ